MTKVRIAINGGVNIGINPPKPILFGRSGNCPIIKLNIITTNVKMTLDLI